MATIIIITPPTKPQFEDEPIQDVAQFLREIADDVDDGAEVRVMNRRKPPNLDEE